MTPMTQNEKMAESHCEFTMSKYGCDECAKHCVLADICKACDGDFSRSVGEDTIAADKAVRALEMLEADNIANSVMVEYYKKQIESANEEIATLKAMNKMLTESIKNLTARG